MSATRVRLFQRLDLPASARPTFIRDFTSNILDAVSAGIFVNVPLMALKGMKSPPWQMAVQLVISGFGLLAVLWIGDYMATRRKMRFVTIPNLLALSCTVGMIFMRSTLLFLILSGFQALLSTISRPGVAAIIRSNYPASHRGAITGVVRRWYILVSLFMSLLSALFLDAAQNRAQGMIQAQLVFAAALSLVSILIYNSIRVADDPPLEAHAEPFRIVEPFMHALRTIKEDARFRRFLMIGFIYGFGGLTYVSFLPVLMDKHLHFSYFASTIYINFLPDFLNALCTGIIGRWLDKTNQWKAWIYIRLGWGMDPILLAGAPLAASFFPPATHILVTMGRIGRGVIAGASWLLWWQIGIAHFAPPGRDTSRYQGMLLFMNGIARIVAPTVGAWILYAGSVQAVLLLGGSLVLFSSLLSAREYRREKNDERLSTPERFEQSFKS